MRNINQIVIHCTATPNGVTVTPERIDGWHRDNGWKRAPEARQRFPESAHLTSIGYHRVVLCDGRVLPGRHEDEVGAHVAGHNANSFAICMVGTNRFFIEQWDALRQYLRTLCYNWQHRLPRDAKPIDYLPSAPLAISLFACMGIKIVGHRDLSPDKNGDGVITPNEWMKTCPGFSVKDWLNAEMMPAHDHIIHSEAIMNPNADTRIGAGRAL